MLPILIMGQQNIVRAPYQVGLYLFDNYSPNYGAGNFPICSAAIIHPLFCATTADCVHAHITSQNIARPLSPTSIYIKSGNFSDVRENIKYVKEIHIHPGFDSKTLKNDIALIQIESSFQFGNPYNERWVQLPDASINYKKCIYSINTPNSTEMYPFGQFRKTTVVSSDACNGNQSNYRSEFYGMNSLCSFYEFDHPFMCMISEDQLRLNRDRGTPLICDNKLAGLLSIIIPSSITNSTECSRTLQTMAYYTNVVLYEKWLHNVIGVNSPPYTANGTPIPMIPNSPPYQNLLTVSKPTNTASAIKSCFTMISLIAFVTWFLIQKPTTNGV